MRSPYKYINYGLILAALLSSGGCKKKDATTPQPTITIDIQSPVEGAVVAQGASLLITAHVTSDVEVHGYEWKLRNKADNTELASGEAHAHGKDLNVNGSYLNNVPGTVQAELEVTVEIDHDGYEANKKVNITLNQ
jgi:hypothetical protein